MGAVERIWVKRAHRGPMDPVSEVTVTTGEGIVGNANRGKRQITLLAREAWDEAAADLGRAVDPIARRANLLVTGIDLRDSTDRVLVVGTCRVTIRGETKPCGQMDRAAPGLQAALDRGWRGGAWGVVSRDATICVGDEVRWQDDDRETCPPNLRSGV